MLAHRRPIRRELAEDAGRAGNRASGLERADSVSAAILAAMDLDRQRIERLHIGAGAGQAVDPQGRAGAVADNAPRDDAEVAAAAARDDAVLRRPRSAPGQFAFEPLVAV